MDKRIELKLIPSNSHNALKWKR